MAGPAVSHLAAKAARPPSTDLASFGTTRGGLPNAARVSAAAAVTPAARAAAPFRNERRLMGFTGLPAPAGADYVPWLALSIHPEAGALRSPVSAGPTRGTTGPERSGMTSGRRAVFVAAL